MLLTEYLLLIAADSCATLPTTGLLANLDAPNAGDNYLLPAELFDTVGAGLFFTSTGTPLDVSAAEILADGDTNVTTILFDGTALAVYNPAVVTISPLNRARRVMAQAPLTVPALLEATELLDSTLLWEY